MEKTFKIARGEEIIVRLFGANLAGVDSQSQSSKKQRSGIIQPRKSSEYLPRRKRKQSGFINFYDLGEYLHTDGETWIDDARTLIPSIAELNIYGLNLDGIFSESDLIGQYNKPFTIPLEDWNARFHKITYEEAFKYRLDVYTGRAEADLLNEDNENWQEQGLKIPKLEDLPEGEGSFFLQLRLSTSKAG